MACSGSKCWMQSRPRLALHLHRGPQRSRRQEFRDALRTVLSFAVRQRFGADPFHSPCGIARHPEENIQTWTSRRGVGVAELFVVFASKLRHAVDDSIRCASQCRCADQPKAGSSLAFRANQGIHAVLLHSEDSF